MFDIDSFKNYNDYLSHIEGDECLKAVVNAVRFAQLFPGEDFYRFGGDEFLIVLPNVSEEELRLIGFNVVQAIYHAKLRSAPNAPYPYVSVSAGAYWGKLEANKNLDDYLAIADKQLYLAKGAGNNRFYFRDQEVKLPSK
jgi:diguanylate cyclase (GGDEF)-like protein